MLKDLNLGVLLKNLDKTNFSFDLDLVLEGGCMNGAYEIGGLILVKELEKLSYFKIKRISLMKITENIYWKIIIIYLFLF